MSCDRFRSNLVRGEIDLEHAEACDRCFELVERQAKRLTETAEPVPVMSRSLIASLREIPKVELGCRDVERLYRQAIASDPSDAADELAHSHLQRCAECQRLYTVIRRGLEPEELSLPERLMVTLADYARKPRRVLPVWVKDIRYAAAACYLTAMLSSLIAVEASALFSETTNEVGSRTSEWVDRSEGQSRRYWSWLVTSADRTRDFVKAHIEAAKEITTQTMLDAEEAFESSNTYQLFARYLPDEGDDNGTANREPSDR